MRRAVLAPAALLPAGLIAAAALIQLLTAWQAALQYDRTAVASGQLWRLLTCHLVHCGWAHLIADLVGFATLWWLACRRPRPVPWLVLISALAIGTALCLLAPDVQTYRGMSGVNFALFGYLLVIRLCDPSRVLRLASWTFLAVLVFNVVYEVLTGEALTTNSLPEGVAVVGVVHAAGLSVGIAVAVVCRRGLADGGSRTRALQSCRRKHRCDSD